MIRLVSCVLEFLHHSVVGSGMFWGRLGVEPIATGTMKQLRTRPEVTDPTAEHGPGTNTAQRYRGRPAWGVVALERRRGSGACGCRHRCRGSACSTLPSSKNNLDREGEPRWAGEKPLSGDQDQQENSGMCVQVKLWWRFVSSCDPLCPIATPTGGNRCFWNS